MTVVPQPDFRPESRLLELPVSALVDMREAQVDWVDQSSILGLGPGDLIDLTLPPFQRGLKWDQPRLKEFHDSLIQGWPMGVIVLAVQSSTLINPQSGQRRVKLSLIDGQQRSWALVQLIRGFWSKPWFMFHNQKWDVLAPPQGSIADAGQALKDLATELGRPPAEVETAVRELSINGGQEQFDDYVDMLDRVCETLQLDSTFDKSSARLPARKLAEALNDQYSNLRDIPIPALLLNESLKVQLPSVFRRLNEGVPLKGYDLLAAMWESERLVADDHDNTRKQLLRAVHDTASKRISETYQDVGSGYEFDPNTEPLQPDELSLFDLLYYLSLEMRKDDTFAINSEVLAFQVSATVFNGSISKVDDDLRAAFPRDAKGGPDVVGLLKAFQGAANDVVSALKPLMDVSSTNLTLRGRIGLTPAVVYIATFLTHHRKIQKGTAGRLVLASRSGSADDRIVRPGEYLNATDRKATLQKTLPSWYVHDSLTSVFAGSRAYEAANDRVWTEFASGSGASRTLTLRVSNEMLGFPPLTDLVDALQALWANEKAVEKTPQRRRISDGGSVLLRAAFSHLHLHSTEIDHVIPLAKARSAASQRDEAYPLNHVANLMPLDAATNSARGDHDWSAFRGHLNAVGQARVEATLLIPWDDCDAACLQDLATFEAFLKRRYQALVGQALTNLQHPDWLALSAPERDEYLDLVVT